MSVWNDELFARFDTDTTLEAALELLRQAYALLDTTTASGRHSVAMAQLILDAEYPAIDPLTTSPAGEDGRLYVVAEAGMVPLPRKLCEKILAGIAEAHGLAPGAYGMTDAERRGEAVEHLLRTGRRLR